MIRAVMIDLILETLAYPFMRRGLLAGCAGGISVCPGRDLYRPEGNDLLR